MTGISGADQPQPEVVIIGAGPAGLWAAFQLGIHGVRSVLIDSNDRIGGQCAALYADKPVYDLPGYAAIDADEIIRKLEDQLARFKPVYRLGETVLAVRAAESGFGIELTNAQPLSARFVILSTGLGPFGVEGKPRPLDLPARVFQPNGHLAVTVDSFETRHDNLYAIGDAIAYPGKLCLLVSAFHEAALMAFDIRKKRAGEKRTVLEYTSTSSALKALFTDR
ncbi:MAG: dependent oxidoreductase family protein [Rhizobium sp.]|nr:dependent oxidoreductase family protein [Rhizobium sp.]